MKARFRLFRRGTVFYAQDGKTRRQRSLGTRDKTEAARLLAALNESSHAQNFNLQLARVYLTASNPLMAERTWRDVFKEVMALKTGVTRTRWENALKDGAYVSLLPRKVIETAAEDFLKVLKAGTVSTNVFLRRVHNFALDMNWLLAPVIPKRQWPAVRYRPKRAITLEEHEKIVAREPNRERRLFYELCWHLGGSQSDIAMLHGEDVDWADKTVGYFRHKLRHRESLKAPLIHFGAGTAEILRQLPEKGPLFPYLSTVDCKDRATEFRQRCATLGIKGVTLHSYRYSWAGRAKSAGYPLRFAMEALGHNSKAVHHAYACKAEVRLPSLEGYESARKDGKIVAFQEEVNEDDTTRVRSAVSA